jgi:general secretion pathway protein A
MYKAFFGLKQNPFNLSPDPSFLYRSAQHEEALANLIYGVKSTKGFIALTGEVGTGKTMMLECLRDYLDAEKIPFGFIFNSQLTPPQFFEMLAFDFDLKCDHHSKIAVLNALNERLLDGAGRGVTTVLIVDEAHNLEWNVLEEIRLLGNLENRKGKLIQVVLSGQPELDRKLDAPEYRQLKQRIALRCALQPFEEEETGRYIAWRLAQAGVPDQTIFPREIVVEIQVRTGGVPRIINVVCENLLTTAFALGSYIVTLPMLDEVSKDLRLEWQGSKVNEIVELPVEVEEEVEADAAEPEPEVAVKKPRRARPAKPAKAAKAAKAGTRAKSKKPVKKAAPSKPVSRSKPVPKATPVAPSKPEPAPKPVAPPPEARIVRTATLPMAARVRKPKV